MFKRQIFGGVFCLSHARTSVAQQKKAKCVLVQISQQSARATRGLLDYNFTIFFFFLICRVYLEIQGKEDLLENLYVTSFLYYILFLTQFPSEFTPHLRSELGCFSTVVFPSRMVEKRLKPTKGLVKALEWYENNWIFCM